MEYLEPYILELLGVILTAIIAIVAAKIQAYTGLKIEAQHRVALHEALMSGVASALEHGPGEGLETLKAHAIAHARESVPDAIKALGGDNSVMGRIAERYLRQMMGASS